MTKADQMIAYRLQSLRDEVRSGDTEMTGKAYRSADYYGREGRGEVIGRGKGMTHAYPEISRAGLTPGQAADAIERGKGKRFQRLRREVMHVLEITETKKRSRGRLSVAPHAGNRKCTRCRGDHTTGEHRFHGKGSFHRTHMFAFNPRKRNPSRKRKNPIGNVVIYGKVLRIEAQKTQPHKCDDECKKFKHRYYHDFKIGPVMYGLPDGTLLIKPKR